MDQELIMQASLLERQSQEIEQNLQIIDTQILELEQFHQDLEFLDKTKETSMLSSLGKGIFLKTSLVDKKLFVDVGSRIILRKTPKETQEIISTQITKFRQAKIQLLGQLDLTRNQFQSLLAQIEQSS